MPPVTDQAMRLTLRGLRALAGWDGLDRLGIRGQVETVVHKVAKTGATAGVRAAGVATKAGRRFSSSSSRDAAARQRPTRRTGLFDLEPTDEQRMLTDALSSFAQDHLRGVAGKADEACETPQELFDHAHQLGVLQLAVPPELDGFVEERSAVTTFLAAEALATGDLGIAAALLAPAAVASAVSLWGTADQQARYLEPFAQASPPLAAFAVQEPTALFDPFDLATTARRDGDELVLNGTKALVPHAGRAELFLVAAAGPDGPVMVLVEAGTDGLTHVAEPAMGLRPTASGTLQLAEVRVPATAVLGADADAARAAYSDAIQRARIAWSALASGTAQAAIDYVIPYVKTREAFGEPVAHRQSVAFMIADMAIEQQSIRLTALRAAALADADKPFAHEAAVARSLVQQRAWKIGSDAVQLLGGHGYVKEHPVERWYRDLRAVGLMEGALLV